MDVIFVKIVAVIEIITVTISLAILSAAFMKKLNSFKKSLKTQDEPQPVILAVLPESKHGYSLDLREDFAVFVSQISSVRVIALTEKVPYNRLVKWVRRLVATNEKISIIYIASHGYENGILFTDGIIDAKRLATLFMLSETDLVILMTCNGYEVAHTLRRHGVKSVIYIDGEIEDVSAIYIMKSLITGLSDGLTLEQSLLFVRAETSSRLAYTKLRHTSAQNYKFKLRQLDKKE